MLSLNLGSRDQTAIQKRKKKERKKRERKKRKKKRKEKINAFVTTSENLKREERKVFCCC